MDRRALMSGAAAAVSATALSCSADTSRKSASTAKTTPSLRSSLPYPVGVAVRQLHLADPDWTRLAAQHISQLTAEWEMKMEYLLPETYGGDGALNFDRGDAIAAFARQNGMTMHGHTLIWYAQDGAYFQRLKTQPDAFLTAYVAYIQTVMTHYRGQMRGWDVVNEPIWNDGRGLRPCLWRDVLGDDYIGLALEAARQADPSAVLFLNDYNLELTPAKRVTFLKLCERLLREGAPLDGIGTQTHISADLSPAALTTAIRDIASLGLKVHISELDISLRVEQVSNIVEPRLNQLKLLDALMAAYDDVPAPQRYGLTVWSLRDKDSWLNGPKERKGLLADEPALFDDLGRPKAMAQRLMAPLR